MEFDDIKGLNSIQKFRKEIQFVQNFRHAKLSNKDLSEDLFV